MSLNLQLQLMGKKMKYVFTHKGWTDRLLISSINKNPSWSLPIFICFQQNQDPYEGGFWGWSLGFEFCFETLCLVQHLHGCEWYSFLIIFPGEAPIW